MCYPIVLINTLLLKYQILQKNKKREGALTPFHLLFYRELVFCVTGVGVVCPCGTGTGTIPVTISVAKCPAMSNALAVNTASSKIGDH